MNNRGILLSRSISPRREMDRYKWDMYKDSGCMDDLA